MTQPLPNQILGDRLMVISKIFGCCAHQLSSGHQRSQFFSKFASSWGRRPSPGNFQNTRHPSIIMIKERYAGCGFIGQSHIRWCPQATGHKMSFAKSNCKRTAHRLPELTRLCWQAPPDLDPACCLHHQSTICTRHEQLWVRSFVVKERKGYKWEHTPFLSTPFIGIKYLIFLHTWFLLYN